MNTEGHEVEDVDKNTQTLLQCLNTITKLKSKSSNYRDKTFQTIHTHTNYYAYNFNSSVDTCIVDSGADSHVGGNAWLPLTPISGPLVKTANVIGFDESSTCKTGLPIIAAVTKVETEHGTMSG